MNIDHIKEGFRIISEDYRGDDEYQHIVEDDLYYDFVRNIAQGTFEGDIQEAAKLLITSLDFKFSRWHA